MFHWRHSHKPSAELLRAFKRDFPVLPRFLDYLDGMGLCPPRQARSDVIGPAVSSDARHEASTLSCSSADDCSRHGHPAAILPDVTSAGVLASIVTDFDSSTRNTQVTATPYLDLWTPSGWSGLLEPSVIDSLPLHSEYWEWDSFPTVETKATSAQISPIPAFHHCHTHISLQDVQLQIPDGIDHLLVSPADSRPVQVTSQSPRAIGACNYGELDLPAKSRFYATLLHGASAVKENDAAISYLDRGRVYRVRVKDMAALMLGGVRLGLYHTYVSIAFDDAAHHYESVRLWNNWKRGRSSAESKAIEFVPGGKARRLGVILVEESFDSFVLGWQGRQSAKPELDFEFRLNFVSTEFYDSIRKGVQGIPLRLQIENRIVSSQPILTELLFYKIKVFRNYGAERKRKHDKTKLVQRIAKLRERTSNGRCMDPPDRLQGIDTTDSPILQEMVKSNLTAQLDTLRKLRRSRTCITTFKDASDDQPEQDRASRNRSTRE